MRTEYIKPEVRIEVLGMVSMVATSVSVGEALEYGTTDTRGRRGSWGDLWNSEK